MKSDLTLCVFSFTNEETGSLIGPRLSRELVVSRAQVLFHDSGLRSGPLLELVLRSRHPLGLSGRRGWDGRRPGLADRRCPRRREQAGGGKLSGWAHHPCPGAGKEALQGAQAGSLGSHASCTQLRLCRSRADPGVLSLLAGTHKHTQCMRCSSGRETFFSFLGAGCCSPCRERVKLGSEPGL